MSTDLVIRGRRVSFDDSYIPEPNSGCWLWSRHLSKRGYGMLRQPGSKAALQAHRWSWELHRGPIPNDLCVCHKCDVPACVNPGHLFLGTHADNMADMAKKGRSPATHGAAHYNSKLSDEQVYLIRASRGDQRELARRFGVHQASVNRIILRKSWRHLPERALGLPVTAERTRAELQAAVDQVAARFSRAVG